ncbi:MAG: hypothetical protein ACYTDY_17050 [Planctomycetota bacterium]|jgi:hypothetical protein
MTRRFVLLSTLLLLFSTSAFAAELAQLDFGGTLNGGSPDALPVELEVGDVVEGPALVLTAEGKKIEVSPRGQLEVRPMEGELELFFVRTGFVRGVIGDKTQIAASVGWYAVPTGEEAEFYLETLGARRSIFKTNQGTALVVYRLFSFLLKEGQGIEIWTRSENENDIAFKTDQGNPGDVVGMRLITADLNLFLVIPKATSGSVQAIQGGEKTHLRSDPGSWKGGKVGISTRLAGEPAQTGSIGPGTFAVIDNRTGEIEFGFVEVEFQIIERAISLTSEFTALATSNFFGVSQ